MRPTPAFAALLATLLAAGCGSPPATGGDAGTPKDGGSKTDAGTPNDGGIVTNDGGTPQDGGTPADGGTTDGGSRPGSHIRTVFLIVMENHNWSDIKGSTSAPYINDTLLPMGAHAENYYDNPKAVHPSEPNYIWLEAGDNLGITNDYSPSTNYQTTTQHLVTQLENAGVTWRSYQEDKPSGCPIHSSGLYAAKHNPMVYFTDVSGNPPSTSAQRCIDHESPMTQLSTDLASNNVAQYNLIIPNLCDDMHNSSGCGSGNAVSHGDTWLSNMVPVILASNAYQNGGAIFITWDESENGEFPIGMIVLSPLAKVGYSNTVRYYHSSMLRTVEQIFGVSYLRDAKNQQSLSDLFQTY